MGISHAWQALWGGQPETKAPNPDQGSTVEKSAFASNLSFDVLSELSGVGSRIGRPGTRELIALYNASPWLRQVVGKISDMTCSVEWCYYFDPAARNALDGARKWPASRLKRLEGSRRNHIIKGLEETGDLELIPENHPLIRLTDDPNTTDMTWRDIIRLTQAWLDLKDEAFWLIERNARGMPERLWPIPPHFVTQDHSRQDGWKIKFRGEQNIYPFEDVYWIRRPNPFDPYARPKGVGDSLADELHMDEYAAKYMKYFFANGAVPSAMVGIEGAKTEQIRDAKRQWLAENRGVEKAHGIHFHNGKLSVETLQPSFKDSDLTNLRAATKNAVREVYGVSPEIFGQLDSSNRATIVNAMTIVALTVIEPRVRTLLPWIQRLADEYDTRIIADYKNSLPEDEDRKIDAMQKLPAAATIREQREVIGLPDRGEEDDVHVISSGMTIRSVQDVQDGIAPEPVVISAPPPRADQDDDDDEPVERAFAEIQTKVTDTLAEEIANSLQPQQLAQEAVPEYRDVVNLWGTEALAGLGASSAFSMLNPFIVDHIEEFGGTRIRGINETTRSRLVALISAETRRGASAEEIKRAITMEFDFATSVRAATIARTENTIAAGAANLEAYQQSGLVAAKQWVTTLDGRARDSHSSMHLQIRRLKEPFESPQTGAKGQHPGEMSGGGSENVRCRCTMVALTGENDPGLTADAASEVYKDFTTKADSREDGLKAAFIRGFESQRERVLTMVDRWFV